MTNTNEAAMHLKTGLDALGVTLSPEPFLNYLSLLNTWNHAYSLTAIHDSCGQVERYILDSLAILPWLRGPRVLDVGSGAGVPGIALAIARPDLAFTLLDSNGKKTRFLTEVKFRLKLENVTIVHTRAELYKPDFLFDMILSCAFSELIQMIHWTGHLLENKGAWLAMKGKYPHAELQDISHPFEVHAYSVPFVNAERCCVIIQK